MTADVQSINIKNRTYNFFNDMINNEDFDLNLLKIDKTSYKNIDIYNIGYITIKKWWLWKYLYCKSFVFDDSYTQNFGMGLKMKLRQ